MKKSTMPRRMFDGIPAAAAHASGISAERRNARAVAHVTTI